jgi:hypothetical protein
MCWSKYFVDRVFYITLLQSDRVVGKTYRAIRKSLCTWWLQYRKLQVMFKVSPVSLQTFIDARLTLTPSVIPNSNYVIMVSDWNWLKYFAFFLYFNQVRRDFLITLYLHVSLVRDLPRVDLSLLVAVIVFPFLAWSEITLHLVSRCMSADTVCFRIVVMFVRK